MSLRLPVFFSAIAVTLLSVNTGDALAQSWKREFSPQAGTVAASQTATRGSWGNPALIPELNPGGRLRWVNSAGAYLNDNDGLLAAFAESREASDELEQTSQQRPLLPGDADRLIAALRSQSGKVLTASWGSESAVSLPWFEDYDLAAGVSLSGRFATGFSFAEQDATTLQAATVFGAFNAADLESRILASGVYIAELFVSGAHTLPGPLPLRLGVTLKHQHLTLFERAIEIDEYDEGDLRNRSRNVATYNHPNIDIGLSTLLGDWQINLLAKNLNGRSFRGNATASYDMNPAVSAGFNYKSGRWLFSASGDITASEAGFDQLRDEKRIRLGTEYRWNDALALRAGSHIVRKGKDRSAATLGLNWRISERSQLQFAWLFAGSREQGGNLQLSLAF